MPKKGDIVYFIFPYPKWFGYDGSINIQPITCEKKVCWVVNLDDTHVTLLPFNTYNAEFDISNKHKSRKQQTLKNKIGFSQEHKFVINKKFVFKNARQTQLDLRNLLKIPHSIYKRLKKFHIKTKALETQIQNFFNHFENWYRKQLNRRAYEETILKVSCFEKINKKCNSSN